jgi:hypothetical protein
MFLPESLGERHSRLSRRGFESLAGEDPLADPSSYVRDQDLNAYSGRERAKPDHASAAQPSAPNFRRLLRSPSQWPRCFEHGDGRAWQIKHRAIASLLAQK